MEANLHSIGANIYSVRSTHPVHPVRENIYFMEEI
jgi:hypothetical protein